METLPGVGPTVAKKLATLGLRTIGDLLGHRPHRYEAAAPEVRIADLLAGEEEVAITGEVVRTSVRRPRPRLAIVQAKIADSSGEITAVWFNQAWLVDKLRPGTRVRLRGQLRRNEFNVRSYDLNGASSTADFAPVYPASEEITPKKLRELVGKALAHARDDPDALPAHLGDEMPIRADALTALHQPRNLDDAERGRRRLAFDELLVLQVGLARRRRSREQEVAPALGEPGELVSRYRELLPFELTPHQERAIEEIDADLAKPTPMERLLQGEVGSGKTVVALYALLRAVESGKKGALMAPTETLAEQHFLTLEEPCRELGVEVALLTRSVKDDPAVAHILVGTHALIQEGVDLSEVAVAVVDEQHRFGVEQRRAITGGRTPHVLHMTATPIPRTLALTVYGDLSVSEIAKPPANRKAVKTAWVTQERSSEAYKRLRKHLDDGRQAYVVCPLVEESEKIDLAAAEERAASLRQVFGGKVGLVHGRMKGTERDDAMARFKAGETRILVATTVIEVGVDVPEASIMVVEHAERFGLSQLHQLRGRVGRGGYPSQCLLVSTDERTAAATKRLRILEKNVDGFSIAEEDMKLRGMGDMMGVRQVGIPAFRIGNVLKDGSIMGKAREMAS